MFCRVNYTEVVIFDIPIKPITDDVLCVELY